MTFEKKKGGCKGKQLVGTFYPHIKEQYHANRKTRTNGNLYDYDEKARDRINAAIVALSLQGDGATIDWTTADNQDVKVTANDLRMVIAAVAVRSNSLHIAYRKTKAQVEAAGTAEEVRAICME